MMPAAKMMDPILGIDIHMIQPPGPVPPLPIPHPFIGMLFDPMDMIPFVGATILINGMPRGIAGTAAKALPPHIPMGGVFVPPPPGNEGEMFMGSATVEMDGDPASYMALPALTCQTIGMPAPFRTNPKKKTRMKSLQLPLSLVLPIPMGMPVLIGGPPTIDMMGMLQKLGMAALGRAMKKAKRAMKASKKAKRVSDRIHGAASALMKKLGVPGNLRNKAHKAICTVTGHPVDVATGKVFTDNVDFELPGAIPLRWERTWFSTSTYRGPLGHGWHHAYDMALLEDGKAVAIRSGDGRPMAFPRLRPAESSDLRSEKATLRRDDRGYVLETREKLLYRFAERPSAQGSCPLVSISNPAGDRILFTYDAKGFPETLRDSAGRLLTFRTDSLGRILGISAPHPDIPGQSILLMSYRYDGNGDMEKAIDALDHPWHYAYRNHLLVRETDRNGLDFRFEYDREDSDARCLRTWGDGGIHDHKLVYDPAAKTTTVEDSLGSKTIYHYADSGLVTRVDDALGHSTFTYLNEFNEIEKEVDALGLETLYAYDERGNRTKFTDPEGASQEIRFADDVPVWGKDVIGGEWTWEYDRAFRPVKTANPLGHVTEYRYDGPRLEALVNAEGHATRFRYGPSGELAAWIDPDGSARLWKYDGLGRCVAETAPNGSVQKRAFDQAGRLIGVEEPDGNLREIEYDPEGNVLRARDRYHDVVFRYQGMGRMASRAERGTILEFAYDKEERLIQVRNTQGSLYAYQLDAVGNVSVETTFDGLKKKYARDAKGRTLAVERRNGLVTEYRYDGCDRVVEVIHSNGEREAFAYREDGSLVGARNDASHVLLTRDALGRIVKDAQGRHAVESEFDRTGKRIGIGSTLGAHQKIARNSRGEAVRIASGKEGSASLWEAEITRNASGQESERILPGGVRSRWTRDDTGRPLRHDTLSPAESRSREYSWDSGDRLKSLRDSRSGRTHFAHDPLGNLIWSEQPDGSHLFRMPDEVGNLYRSADRSDRVYGPSGQLLEAKAPQGTTRYEYDAEGNLIRKIQPGGKVSTYHWNAAGMLVKVVRPDGLEVGFAYDALRRRISKTFRGRTTRWVWDGHDPLHEWVEKETRRAPESLPAAGSPGAEGHAAARREAALASAPPVGPPSEAKGTSRFPVTWVFEPGAYAPMAKLVGENRYSIVADHLGAPMAMFDGRGRESWSAQIDIYGRMEKGRGELADCPFRFPGQYEDEETGLLYNRFRYYDPEAGSYLSEDPIGFAGGFNLHAYVQDPMTWMDPLGLSCKPKKTRVFWSGNGNPRVKAAAEKWARENGATTLEMTGKGSLLQKHSPNLDWIEAQPAWKKASKEFAKGASDEIHVFLNKGGVSPASVWETTEKGILKDNNVRIIEHLID